MSDRLLTARPGERLTLLGNEAVARGALEAGVLFVSGYPGTPASEIGDTFARLHREAGVHFEWSVNEKVALETAFGAAIMGARALCHMKHLGLAYAGDPLGTIPYVGVLAGMVIVSAADPGMVVSPNEQDQRHLARMNLIPVLEPGTPAEALALTRYAFTLSEETGLPVILRTSPPVAHARGIVTAGTVEPRGEAPSFERRPADLTPIPLNARRMREKLGERIRQAEEILARSPLFPRTGRGPLGVLAAGVPLALVLDRVEEMELLDRVTVQGLGATHPVPRAVLEAFLGAVDRVLVVEELSPFLEDLLRAFAFVEKPGVRIEGMRTGFLPDRGALTPDLVGAALARFAGATIEPPEPAAAPPVPGRPPTLCPGCAHRSTYLAVRAVFGDGPVYLNDIGCYTLGYGPPLETVDALLSMGSSIAMASAASRVLGRKALAFVGDSTFYHSGIPPLLNAVEQEDDVLVVILDNRVTAMTGHQPSASTPGTATERRGVSPEGVARALGIERVTVIDPTDLGAAARAFLREKRTRGPAVIVARRDCAVVRFREQGARPEHRRYAVDPDRCRRCRHDSESLFCGQGPIREVERALVLRRILDQGEGEEPVPAPVTEEAPCSAACPAGICVQGYVGRIAGGRYAEALALIRRRNPLPAVSSRVCHRPCEDACTRREIDGPIAINDLKRFVADHERARDPDGGRLPPGPPTGRRVAVIGAGPSGLACALELTIRGHEVSIFDEHERPGGLLVQAIPTHRLPRDVVEWETGWILGHGISFVGGVRVGEGVTVSGLLESGYDAVYLGVGAMTGLPLGVPGDGLPGIVSALDLLRRHHRGEESPAAEKRFLVVGGGDAAVDAARTLVRRGAAAVEIVYRRTREEMPAHPEEVDAAEEEGVVVSTGRAPVGVLGTDRAEGLRVIRTEPGAPGADGRRRPVPVPGTEEDLPADGIVAAVGQRPDLSFLDVDLDLTEDGAIRVVPETGATSEPGIFAGGDVTPGPKTVIHATAEGRRAAYGIDLYLAGEGREVAPLDAPFLDASSPYEPRNARPEPSHHAGLRKAAARRRDHEDVVVPLTEEEAREEAARCLLCGMCRSCSACTDLFGCPAFREADGRMTIDEALCNGCGVCVAFCPNGAIHEVIRPSPASGGVAGREGRG